MRTEHLDRQLVLVLQRAKGGFLNPSPCPAKLTYKYNTMLTYISVSFFCRLFSFKNFVPVTVKNRVMVTVSSGVRVRVRVSVRVRVTVRVRVRLRNR